ncbi:hypothetical protein ACPCSE_29555 [Streptomyces cellulosae]
MADLINAVVEAAPEAVSDNGDPQDPFQGDSQRLSWSRDMELGQLQEEVREALGEQVQLAVLFEHDEHHVPLPVDSEHPAVIYVHPSSTDLGALRQVLAAHRPDPYYGMTEEERAQAQVREKVAAGKPLTPDEMQLAFRMLLG